MRWHIVSNSLLPSRCPVLLVVLLLTANLIGARRHVTRGYHVTRTKSYPVDRRAGDAAREIPDTNGMFFGKRSTATLLGVCFSSFPASVSLLSRHLVLVCHVIEVRYCYCYGCCCYYYYTTVRSTATTAVGVNYTAVKSQHSPYFLPPPSQHSQTDDNDDDDAMLL